MTSTPAPGVPAGSARPPVVLTTAQLASIRRLVLGARRRPGMTLAGAAASLAVLLAGDERARGQLALLRAGYAALLAAARAAVAAGRHGEGDPLGYVRGVLAGRGQLPADGTRPPQLPAGARGLALPAAGSQR